MKNSSIFGLTLAGIGSLTASLLATRVQAATMQFDDRTAFENAATSLTTETFNSFTEDVFFPRTNNPEDGYDVGDLRISKNASNDFFKRIESNGGDRWNIDGTPFVLGIGDPGEAITLFFENPITAFGVDLTGVNNSREATRVIIGSDTFSFPVVQDLYQRSFFGVTSDTPFDAVVFSAIKLEAVGLDNVSYALADSEAAAVPESSSTIALFALAGLGLFQARRLRVNS